MPSAKKETGPEDVEAYLSAVPEEPRAELVKLRETIRKAAPKATEGLSYGIPAFRMEGRPLVAYAALKNHCSFFPMSPAVLEEHKEELQDFDTAKGTIRFTLGKPPPAALVRSIVKARIAEHEAS